MKRKFLLTTVSVLFFIGLAVPAYAQQSKYFKGTWSLKEVEIIKKTSSNQSTKVDYAKQKDFFTVLGIFDKLEFEDETFKTELNETDIHAPYSIEENLLLLHIFTIPFDYSIDVDSLDQNQIHLTRTISAQDNIESEKQSEYVVELFYKKEEQ